MSTSLRWGLRAALGLAGLCALLALLGGLAYVWANSEAGRAWIAREAGRALSTPGESVVTFEGLGGRLPGDIVVEREGFRFYFPVVTSILISLVLTLILWFINR